MLLTDLRANLTGVKWKLKVLFICISIMAKDVEHLSVSQPFETEYNFLNNGIGSLNHGLNFFFLPSLLPSFLSL